MKKTAKLITSLLLSVSAFFAQAGAFAFTDTAGHWAEDVITEMTGSGYLSGYPDGSFMPDSSVTNAEFASIISRVFNFPLYDNPESIFYDVPNNAWYAPFAAAAELVSLSSGDGYFHGDEPINRLDTAFAMCSIFNFDFINTNSAVNMDDYDEYSPDKSVCTIISTALDNGIMSGTDSGFAPYKTLTRAELCSLISRAIHNIGLSRAEETTLVLNNIIYSLQDGDSSYNEPFYTDINSDNTETPDNVGSLAAEVLELVNECRAEEGLKPLVWDSVLAEIATKHCDDMIERGFVDHINPDGESPFDRMHNAGITYKAAGENIAAGQRSPKEVVDSWMNSPGHRANIMSPDFGRLGIGIAFGGEYGIYWVQCFTD